MVSTNDVIFQQEKEKQPPSCFIEVKLISAGEGQVTSYSLFFPVQMSTCEIDFSTRRKCDLLLAYFPFCKVNRRLSFALK